MTHPTTVHGTAALGPLLLLREYSGLWCSIATARLPDVNCSQKKKKIEARPPRQHGEPWRVRHGCRPETHRAQAGGQTRGLLTAQHPCPAGPLGGATACCPCPSSSLRPVAASATRAAPCDGEPCRCRSMDAAPGKRKYLIGR